jgi:hypothetical protein
METVLSSQSVRTTPPPAIRFPRSRVPLEFDIPRSPHSRELATPDHRPMLAVTAWKLKEK